VVTPACSLKHVLREAAADFMKVLDRHTLADLVKSPAGNRRMIRLLAVDARG
jgi:DNA-binding IscR family transcriptional regulator